MSKKNPDSGMTTNFKNGQSNEYIYHSDDRHEHYWYNTKTGMMGNVIKLIKYVKEQEYVWNMTRHTYAVTFAKNA